MVGVLFIFYQLVKSFKLSYTVAYIVVLNVEAVYVTFCISPLYCHNSTNAGSLQILALLLSKPYITKFIILLCTG